MGEERSGQSWEALRTEAVALAEAAASRKLVLKLAGSAGVRLSSPEAERLMGLLRPPPKDLDYICRSRDRNGLQALFVERGYAVDRDMLVAMEGQRYAFRHGGTGLKIDLFVDRLEFCHTVEPGRRLEAPGIALGGEDLLLHKLQIQKPTRGDLADLGVMLSLQDVGPGGFDPALLLAPLQADWGFCHTVERNLAALAAHAESGGYGPLGAEAGSRISARARAFLGLIEAAPKSMRWKLRAKIGERMQWWQDVDDREGTY